MNCDMIKFPQLFPSALKKKLLFNMLLVMMTTLTVFLGASECDILGHKIAAAFTRLEDASKSSVLKVLPGHSKINTQNVADFVEGLLRSDTTWLPVSIERAIITSVAVIVLTIFEEIFVDFRVNLIGATVKFHLAPGPKHLRVLPIEEYRSSILANKGGNAGRKNKVPIIAKWKEMTRAQYIEALNARKEEAMSRIKDIDMLLAHQTNLCQLSLRRSIVSVLALASGACSHIVETKKHVDNEEVEQIATTSKITPQKGHRRIFGALESSKYKMNTFLKNTKSATKSVIPKSMKKNFNFSASTEDSETKEDPDVMKVSKIETINRDYGMFDQAGRSASRYMKK